MLDSVPETHKSAKANWPTLRVKDTPLRLREQIQSLQSELFVKVVTDTSATDRTLLEGFNQGVLCLALPFRTSIGQSALVGDGIGLLHPTVLLNPHSHL